MNTNMVDVYNAAMNDYLADTHRRGMSDKTVENYKKRTAYFRDFWQEHGDTTHEPTMKDVRNWRDSIIDAGTSLKTAKQYLIELRSFFSFASDPDLGDDRYFEKNPVSTKLYPVVKNENTKPYEKMLSGEDMAKLFANERYPGAKNWERNYAIVVLLLDSKIRNAELLDLKLNDIDFEWNEATIRKGKGGKFRIVPLSDVSVSAIKMYLNSGIRPSYCTDDDYLFGTTAEHTYGNAGENTAEWHRGTSQWLSGIVERHVKAVTGKEGYRSHSMRHNGSRMLLNTGASMEELQSELGHSSVNTTQIYSGKLLARRSRGEMQNALAARDEWGKKNMEMLTATA